MRISEVYVNATEGYQVGESGPYEPFTDHRGQLFRALQREHGRCVSRLYIDRRVPAVPDDPTATAYRLTAEPIGWVFEKRATYTDTGEPYTHETWVEVLP